MSGLEIRDQRFADVVGRSLVFEKLVTGCIFTEGPLWHRRDRYLLFSDMPGDHLRRWSQQQGVSTFRKPCHKSNGLAWDNYGSLTVLASHYGDKELNSQRRRGEA